MLLEKRHKLHTYQTKSRQILCFGGNSYGRGRSRIPVGDTLLIDEPQRRVRVRSVRSIPREDLRRTRVIAQLNRAFHLWRSLWVLAVIITTKMVYLSKLLHVLQFALNQTTKPNNSSSPQSHTILYFNLYVTRTWKPILFRWTAE